MTTTASLTGNPAIIAFLEGKKILGANSHWVSFCNDTNDDNVQTNPTRTIQYSYSEKRWYEYRETGRADCPTEEFVAWID